MKTDIHPDYVATDCDLHLRLHLHDAQHRQERRDPRRGLLAVPPVLHRQAEDPRHRRPRGPLRDSFRQDGRPAPSSCPSTASEPASEAISSGADPAPPSCSGLQSVLRREDPTCSKCIDDLLAEYAGARAAKLADPAIHADQNRGAQRRQALRRARPHRRDAIASTRARAAISPPAKRTRRRGRRRSPRSPGARGARAELEERLRSCCMPRDPHRREGRHRRDQGAARAARSPRCSPATCCGCTSATPSGGLEDRDDRRRPSPTSAATRTCPSRSSRAGHRAPARASGRG